MTQHILVLAHYPDGQTREVTREAVITSNNSDVAGITNGVVTATRRGEAAILVRRRQLCDPEVTVRAIAPATSQRRLQLHRQTRRHEVEADEDPPSDLCTDAEFIGAPPSISPERRPHPKSARILDDVCLRAAARKLVDELIGRDFIEHGANKWADLLHNGAVLGEKAV